MNEDVYRFLLSRRLSSNDVKARLTTWLIDQRRQGVIIPVVTYEIAYSFIETEDRRSLPVAKRAEKLLRFLVNRTRYTGETVLVDECYESALAWSESIDVNEVFFLLNYLSEQGFIYDYKHVIKGPERCLATVSVEGYGFLEELIVNPDSSQAFVAMWFADEMNNAYENGIRPAIKKAGYKPLRIDLKHDVKKIDDEIFAEIRRSRFLVADMTQGDDGARGGVYFEAGLASGLELPVLYTCFHEKENLLSLDTRQFYHILWDTPEDLHKQLVTRILARIGKGPL